LTQKKQLKNAKAEVRKKRKILLQGYNYTPYIDNQSVIIYNFIILKDYESNSTRLVLDLTPTSSSLSYSPTKTRVGEI